MSVLFRFFDAVNREDFQFVDRMTDEEVKEISPYVLLGWMNGAVQNNGIHVMLTDIYCNQKVFSLQKHPRLLLKLFIEANGGIDSTRYKYKKPSISKSHSSEVKAIAAYYGVPLKDAKDYLLLLDADDMKQIMAVYEDSDEKS